MCELLRHFLLPLRRLIRRTRPLIARLVLPPRPLAGEGWGEGGTQHERSKVPYHSPHPSPALLATPDSGDSSGCFERQVPLKTSTSDSRQLFDQSAFGAPGVLPCVGRNPGIRLPAAKRRVVSSGLNFLCLLSFLKKESESPAGARPGQQTSKNQRTEVKCSTTGGAAKNGPTIARHSPNAGDPRKSTVWFSSVSHWICSR